MKPLYLLVIIAFPIMFAVGGWLTGPLWDDAWLVLLIQQGGGIERQVGDRPLVGYLWELALRLGVFWEAGLLVHVLSWSALAWATSRVWLLLAPELPRHAPVVAALAISPALCETQLLIVTTMLTSQVPALMAFAAALLVVRGSATESKQRRAAIYVSGFGLVLLGAQLSDYAVAGAVAAAFLVAFVEYRRTGLIPRSLIPAAVLIGAAVVGYAIYWMISDPAARPNVRPEAHLLGDLTLRRIQVAGVRLLNDTWSLIGGKALETLGAFHLQPDYAGIGRFLLAVAIAAFFVFGFHSGRLSRHPVATPFPAWIIPVCAIGIVFGLFPVVLMGRHGALDGMTTRYWLPVLPLAACASYAVLLLASARISWVAPGVVGFLLTYGTAALVADGIWIKDRSEAWGQTLNASLSDDGLTLAVFLWDDRRHLRVADYELTARVTREWNGADRRRFWAIPELSEADQLAGERPWGDALPPAAFVRTVRGVAREGRLARVILARVRADGKLVVSTFEGAAEVSSMSRQPSPSGGNH